MQATSRNAIRTSVVGVLLLCAQSALGQTRPIVSEYFQSPVSIQIIESDAEVARGVGRVVFDQAAGKGRVRYALPGSRTDIISRYDLGAVFDSEPPTCAVTPVAGPMPLTWGWIAQSKQAEITTIDGITVVFWTTTGGQPSVFGLGEGIQRIGTTLEDSTTPVFYELVTPERTVRLRFRNFRTVFRAKPNLFKLPRGCVR
jgi:hypothetical protein